MERKPTKLPQKPATQVSRIEKIGYKMANGLHKVGVLTLVTFILGNIFIFAREYNNYWKARRNPGLIFDLEKRSHNK